jgi:diguanylate cyclase (GGDEF)-like protein
MAAVAIVDLDNFRMINDSLGREASDALLRHASERMQHVLRAGDTIARIAGDQFAILFERISGIDEAYQITERMLEAFATPFILAGRELTVTAGAGIVVNGPGYRSPEDLLRNAALALRRAKTGGTGRINVFHQGMHAVALNRLEREIALRAAIERQEIALAWQPTVSLRDRRVTGMEALARWRMPNGSIVTPSEFIPLAEETGLIVPLGRWILREACRQVSAWRAMAPDQTPVEVSVNLSARQLHQHSIVEDVLTVLQETAVDPRQVVLELTESAVMADVPVAAAVLAELRAAGLRFAIDDFGTGHSALSYLRDFPFDYLKIDRSFIAGLDGVGGDRVLVSSVIGLARGLGLTTIAEGVETARQAEMLRSLGCDVAQGNYFSFPLSADEMTILLARRDALVLAAGD